MNKRILNILKNNPELIIQTRWYSKNNTEYYYIPIKITKYIIEYIPYDIKTNKKGNSIFRVTLENFFESLKNEKPRYFKINEIKYILRKDKIKRILND